MATNSTAQPTKPSSQEISAVLESMKPDDRVAAYEQLYKQMVDSQAIATKYKQEEEARNKQALEEAKSRIERLVPPIQARCANRPPNDPMASLADNLKRMACAMTTIPPATATMVATAAEQLVYTYGGTGSSAPTVPSAEPAFMKVDVVDTNNAPPAADSSEGGLLGILRSYQPSNKRPHAA